MEVDLELIAGRYRLGEVLGRGGMGEVRAAHDLRLDRPVAIKLLRADLAADRDLRHRFETEARAAAGLSHPAVVSVYDTGVHEGIPYIVMERLSGRTLADQIEAGPLDPERVRRIAAEVLGALDAAHALGIVHRDIKPGNVLIAEDGSSKVADFGIAKVAGTDLTMTGQILGTPAYLAPERLAGLPDTPRTDLYSVGAMLFEALSGRKAFDGESPWAVATRIQQGDRPRLTEVRPDVDPALAAAVERAMDPDADRRFADASEMARALDGQPSAATAQAEASAHAETPAPAEGPAPEAATARLRAPTPTHPLSVAGALSNRRRAAVLALVGAIVVVALVVAIALLGSRGPGSEAPTTPPPADGSVPDPLREALDRLEEAVRP